MSNMQANNTTIEQSLNEHQAAELKKFRTHVKTKSSEKFTDSSGEVEHQQDTKPFNSNKPLQEGVKRASERFPMSQNAKFAPPIANNAVVKSSTESGEPKPNEQKETDSKTVEVENEAKVTTRVEEVTETTEVAPTNEKLAEQEPCETGNCEQEEKLPVLIPEAELLIPIDFTMDENENSSICVNTKGKHTLAIEARVLYSLLTGQITPQEIEEGAKLMSVSQGNPQAVAKKIARYWMRGDLKRLKITLVRAIDNYNEDGHKTILNAAFNIIMQEKSKQTQES